MEEAKRISAGELVVGLGLIGLGGLFILGQIFSVDFWNLIWPIFVMLPGLVFFAVMLIGSRNLAPFAIPGSIITTTGLVLFYQNVTGHWESWAYIWALIAPTSVGVGLWLAGTRSENPSLREAGSTVTKIGLAIFTVSGLFFEVILGIGDTALSDVFWPILLILIGVYIIVRRYLPGKHYSSAADEVVDVDPGQDAA